MNFLSLNGILSITWEQGGVSGHEDDVSKQEKEKSKKEELELGYT